MPTILVIEDEPNILANTVDILRFEGYDVQGTQYGRIGLSLAQSDPPDLILCDIMMPEVNGYHVLNGIRANPATRDIPLVMMSARVDASMLAEVVGLGASAYLPKPFTMPELMLVVRRCLDAN